MGKKFDPDRHHRRSIRLKGYDYTSAGAYFVTICVQNRECLLGEVIEGRVSLSGAGRMVQSIWDALPQYYPGVDIDAFVVMPNHVHGIIVLTEHERVLDIPTGQAQPIGQARGPSAGQARGPSAGQARGPAMGQARGPAPTLSLPDVVQRFKSLTTARYRQGVIEENWPPFPGRLWQRNYYEHIIRNEAELNSIREYIFYNPDHWVQDEENPSNPRFP